MGVTYDNKENLMNLIDQFPPYPPTSSPLKSRTNQKQITDPATSLIYDTGKTGNFAAVRSNICTNVQPVTQGVSILLPDTSYMHSTHVGEIPLPYLPVVARKVHLFPKTSRALLAIPVLCNHGCQAICKASGLVVKNNSTGRTILKGMRDTATGLWIVDLAKQIMSHNSELTAAEPEILTANSVIVSETMPERIQLLQAALGYPVLTTSLDAIENCHYT